MNSGSGRAEGLAEGRVEGPGHVLRHLDVLHLVVPDGHVRRVVGQDVGRHQHRVGEQADAGLEPFATLSL